MLDTYMLAMLGQPINAFRSVVYKILVGSLDSHLRFVPLPPELANYVRAEAALIRKLGAPLMISAPSQSSMQTQMEKRWQGQRVLLDGIDHDTFRSMARQGKIPAGAIHVPILAKVFAQPDPEFFGVKAESQAVARFRSQKAAQRDLANQAMDIQTETERAYWAKIRGLRDHPNINADQAAFREQVEQQLGDQ